MASGKFDFANRGGVRRALEQGATFDHTVVWKDEDGNPIDLTGYTVKLQARESASSEDTALDLSTTNGKITVSEENGLRILLSSTDTAELTPGEYIYDLILTSPGGVKTRLLEGAFHITAAVSR